MFGLFKRPKPLPDASNCRISIEKSGLLGHAGLMDLQVKNDHALAVIDVAGIEAAKHEPLRVSIEKHLKELGFAKSQILFTAERQPPAPPKLESKGKQPSPPLEVPFKHIIAVASGKGGVGKSTLAASIAIGLAQAGHKVGLLDADIYGPSQPLLFGLSSDKPTTNEDGKINPPTIQINEQPLKLMSIGFLADSEAPLIWRGPMVQSAIVQLVRDVDWSDTDILILDMPPGTGDAQLTIAQKLPATGAVVVSTPQDLALIDARKGIAMFEKTGVKILGLVENMASFCCSNCGHVEHIFGNGGVAAEAAKRNVPFLGSIPLHPALREAADNGLQHTELPEAVTSAIAEIVNKLQADL